MKTFFASPERIDELKLRKSISQAGTNEVITGLLQASAGILAVLNEQRQVLAVNDAFLREFGIHDAGHVLGLRPGEAVGCVHAWDMEAGCGTSQWCATCGAAIAIVAALAQKKPQQRKCVSRTHVEENRNHPVPAVHSSLISVGKANYVVLFLQDISDPERRAALERIFLHDLKNLAMGIRFAADLMNDKNNASLPEIAAMMNTISARLTSELSVQTTIAHAGGRAYKPERTRFYLPTFCVTCSTRFSTTEYRGASCLRLRTILPLSPSSPTQRSWCACSPHGHQRFRGNRRGRADQTVGATGATLNHVLRVEQRLHPGGDIAARISTVFFHQGRPGQGIRHVQHEASG